MSDIRVASRYAKSLFDLAVEKQKLEEVHNDMQLFFNTVKANSELAVVLKNPIISNEKKRKILKALFGSKVSEMTNMFFDVISRKNREAFLPLVAKEFKERYNAIRGISTAQVTTTFPLTPDLRKKFESIVAGITGDTTVELSEKIDPSLIGGYKLKIGDRQIDESLNAKLKELRSQLIDTSYVKAI